MTYWRIDEAIPDGGLYLCEEGIYIADSHVPGPARLAFVRPHHPEILESGCDLIMGEVPAGGLFIKALNIYITGMHDVISRVHSEAATCSVRGCSVHAPSNHSMREYKTHWRSDRGLMERICPHGVGHPDPDHMAFLQSLVIDTRVDQAYVDAEGVHGCDGCCGAIEVN